MRTTRWRRIGDERVSAVDDDVDDVDIDVGVGVVAVVDVVAVAPASVAVAAAAAAAAGHRCKNERVASSRYCTDPVYNSKAM